MTDLGPHAVSTASGQPFCYDANGNMTKGYNFRSSRARTYAWTTYNKPSQIVEGATTLTFSYGADRRRFKQVSSGGLTTLYVGGGLFEKRTRGTATTEVHHIQVQGRAVAVYTSLSSTTQSIRYLLNEFNLDGFVDILVRGLGGAITGALDQIVYAPGRSGGSPVILNAVDSSLKNFLSEVSSWTQDPTYFQRHQEPGEVTVTVYRPDCFNAESRRFCSSIPTVVIEVSGARHTNKSSDGVNP